MKNIKLTIEYDGTRFSGWQRQNNALSVQEVVEKAIYKLTGESVEIFGASRTDAGVHARGQVANFFTGSTIPPLNFTAALNSKLPNDVSIVQSEEVFENFHARYSSRGKKYSYKIFNRKAPPAYMGNFYAHCPQELDFESMKKCLNYIIGTHDFATFKSTGSSAKTTIRTIENLTLDREGDLFVMEIIGNGFLYNMVRIIAGTLMDVGKGKINPEDIPKIIESNNRKLAGKTGPACGLCLEKVYY